MKPERTARSYRRLVKGMTRPRTFAEFLAASSAQRRCREFCPVACTRPASAHGSTRPLPPRRKSEGQRYGFPRYKIKIFLLRSRGNRPPAPGRPAAPGHAERDEALLLNGAAKLGRDHPTRCALGETLRALLLLWGLLWRPIRVLERPPSAFPTLLFSPLPVRWGVAETPLAAVSVGRSACRGVRSRALWDDSLAVLRLILTHLFRYPDSVIVRLEICSLV